MAKNKFDKYFKNLLEYQNKALPSVDKLSRDYIIIYDYIMDLLAGDEIISKFLVRKKQTVSKINADILLDLTKCYKICPISNVPSFSLTLQNDSNLKKTSSTTPHPFCDQNLTILPNKITKHVWLALKKGLAAYSSFVRGHQDDIYELSISPEDFNEYYVRIKAYNQDVVLHATLRILIKYCNSPKKSKTNSMSYDLKTEGHAVVPRRRNNSMFEICLLSYENTIKNEHFTLVAVFRLMQFLFENREDLHSLDVDLIEVIALSGFMEIPKYFIKDNTLLFRRILIKTLHVCKTKNLPHIWNTQFNLMECVNDNICEYVYAKAKRLLNQYNIINDKNALAYEEFCALFELEDMDSLTYEVDQFGIFKSYTE